MGERTGQREPPFPLLARAWPLALAMVSAAVLAVAARSPFRSFDTYFHLRFGEEFRGAWSIAAPGQPSTASTNDWHATQWLPQIGLSAVHDLAGDGGLVVVLATSLAVFASSLYLLLRGSAGSSTAAALTLVVIVGCLPNLSLRPQLISFVLAVVTLAAWEHARRTGRPPWFLVPLAWIWAVSHGMWILGIAMSAVLAGALVWERGHSWREAARFGAVPALMLVAVCLTPSGPGLVRSVLLVNSRAEHFHEWRSPDLTTLAAAPVTALLGAAVLMMLRRGGPRPFDLGLLLLAGSFSIYSQRTLPLALVTLAAIVASESAQLLARRGRSRRAVSRAELATVLASAAACVVLAVAAPRETGAAADLEPFDANLASLPEGTMVLTDRVYGSSLLWTEPDLDIPIHGYGDVYTGAELEAYDDLLHLEPEWDITLRRLGATIAVLPEDEPLSYALEQQGWSVTDRTDDVLLMRAPDDSPDDWSRN